MRVISIGTDRKIFDEDSAVRLRIIEYGKLFDELHIVVFTTGTNNYESRIKLSDNTYVYATNSRNKLWYIIDAFKISKSIIRNSGFIIQNSVISCQDPFETGVVGLLLKFKFKIPLQIQIHTDFTNRYFILHSLLNFIRFPLGLFILGFADSVRVVSQKIADSIHSLSHNIEVLPINVSQNAKLKVKDDSQKQKSYGSIEILTVCRLENEKDLETAIRAFKEAVEMGANATFTIVGDGSQREYLKNLSKTLNLESRIFFVGWQNDLEEYYKNADIYISTSLYEGYGMSSIEAAMHGLPLILSNTGVAGSIFKDGREAIICGQKNVDSFTGAIIRLASDSGLRKEIGERARDSANSVQVNREEYLRRYKNSISDAIAFYNNGQSAFKKSILLRYFCAGITGASTQIGLLYLFTDIVGIWYIYSSMMAFAAALCVSFLLQKFWTFNDRGINKAHHQFLRYFGVAVAGILINTALMFLFVDIAGIWYILAQVIAGAFIMVFNFLMYKFFIFHKK